MAGLLIQMGGLLIHHCCGCRGSPPLVAHSTQHPAHMHHVSSLHIIQIISKVNIMFYSLVISHLMFTLPNTINNEHIKFPPASAHFHITPPGGKSIPGMQLAAAHGARRHRRASAGRRTPAPARARRPPTAGGRLIKAVCALLVHTSPSDATPPLHPQILYVRHYVKEFLPRRHCECEVLSLGRFNQGSAGGIGLGAVVAAFACARRRPSMRAVVASKLVGRPTG